MAAVLLGRPNAVAGDEIRTPADFIHAIHRTHRPGKRVFLAHCDGQGKWRHFPLTNCNEYGRADMHEGETAWYVTLHEFRNWRSNELTSCIKNVFVDLDCHDPDSPTPQDAYIQAIKNLQEHGAPLPHVATFTGRGVQLVWTLKRVGIKPGSFAQTPVARYELLTRELASIAGLMPDGRNIADTTVTDLARVIRLPGTLNQHNGQVARAHWVNPTDPLDFHQLCDAVLSLRRAVVRAWKKDKAATRAAGAWPTQEALPVVLNATAVNSASPGQIGTDSSGDEPPARIQPEPEVTADTRTAAQRLAETNGLLGNKVRCCHRGIADIEEIAHASQVIGVREGYRDQLLFALGVFMSWTIPFAQMHEIENLILHKAMVLGLVADGRAAVRWKGKVNAPLALNEARTYLGSVIKRAKAAASKHRANKSFSDDPRYYLSRKGAWARLGNLVESLGISQRMQHIAPRPPKAQKRSPRPEAPRDRVASGRYKRHHPSADTRAQACALVDGGQPISAVARIIGVCRQTLSTWLKQRAAHPHPANEGGDVTMSTEPTVASDTFQENAPNDASPGACNDGSDVEIRPSYICPVGAGCDPDSSPSPLRDTGSEKGRVVCSQGPEESCKLVRQVERGHPCEGMSTGTRQPCWESTSAPAQPVVQQPQAVGNDVVPSGADSEPKGVGGAGGGILRSQADLGAPPMTRLEDASATNDSRYDVSRALIDPPDPPDKE